MFGQHAPGRPPSAAAVLFSVFLALHAVAHLAGLTLMLQHAQDGTSVELLGGLWTVSSPGTLRVLGAIWLVLGVVMLVAAIEVLTGRPHADRLVGRAAAASLVFCVIGSWAAFIGVLVNVFVLAVATHRSPALFVGDSPVADGVDESSARSFLDLGRIALVGASADPRKFGNTVHRTMREHGLDVVAVNPAATEVNGERCYPELAAVPGRIDGVLVMVTGDAAVDVVHQAAAVGVRRVWLFRGAGSQGAMSEAAVDACRQHGIDVVAGACPLMFLEPVGAVHRLHRTIRHFDGTLSDAV